MAYGTACLSGGVSGKNRNRFRLGAVLLDGSFPILAGTNSYKTHPELAKFTLWPHLHAETAVIINAGKELCNGKSMFVVRVKKDGTIANSKPCDTCIKMLKMYGITNIYYTYENGWSNLCLGSTSR